MKPTWWKEGVIYQIYPRSFYDSNHDGIGDLNGIREKIPYLKKLGIDIIWLSPVYKSPNDDNGYDISDYCDIMDEFGTMEDFDHLLEEIHQHGLKLIMDLVVNHSSDEHRWFQESRKSRDNPYRDYYIWHPPVNGGPPNNWKSFFSGSAWEFDETTGEYYLHLFSKKQPDLNWENPKLREEIYSLMRFWLDKGVDGFRMDVIPFISKPDGFPDKDWENTPDYGVAYANGPRVHEYLQEMNREVISKYNIMTVGEGVGISAEQANLYVGEDRNELNMIFHFDHMFIDHGPDGRMDKRTYDLSEFLEIFDRWEKALGDKGWGSIYLGNHDFPRMVTRFGDSENFHRESAKLLATLILSKKGTTCIYQGDEIGMTNTPFESAKEYRDIEFVNAYNEMIARGGDEDEFLEIARTQARDHARTPVQWNSGIHGGFSKKTPWIRANNNYGIINVAAQEEDNNSILNYYRKMIRLRKDRPALVYGSTTILDSGSSCIHAYERTLGEETFWVLLNLSPLNRRHHIHPVDHEILISNYPKEKSLWNELRPWEARVLKVSGA